MKLILYIAAGGAIGASCRFLIQRLLQPYSLPGGLAGFPFAVLLINIIGCFAAGLIVALLLRHLPTNEYLRQMITAGILGGFTTFSAFALEFQHLTQSNIAHAFAYALLSMLLPLCALWLGLLLANVL